MMDIFFFLLHLQKIFGFMVRLLTVIVACFLSLTIMSQGDLPCENKKSLIIKLSHICRYPAKLQDGNQEAFVAIEYKTNKDGKITKRRLVFCNNRKFRKTTLRAFDSFKNIQMSTAEKTDTIYFQYKIQGSSTPIHPLTDITVIGYGSADQPTLMK
ncbi:tonB family domain protein [Prevotella sp. CAG:1320]|nr:tonB family domain protein [Prevotella sp. CAG:1320]